MAAWGHAGAAAAPAPARRPRPRSGPAARLAPARRPATRGAAGLRGGVTWIALLAILLGGIVALNVAVLQLNVRLDRLGQERADLRAANSALSAQLSSAGAPPHVVSVAHRRLGLVQATPEQTTYVQLAPGP